MQNEIEIDFVVPTEDCSLCDSVNDYVCFDCEREQVKEEYPNSHYKGYGIWVEKKKEC